MPTMRERIEKDLPRDIIPVLFRVSTAQLRSWAREELKLDKPPEGQAELVRLLIEKGEVAPLLQIYEGAKLSPQKMAVTWFAGGEPPTLDKVRISLADAPYESSEFEGPRFALVWAEEVSDQTRVRVAYRQSRRSVRDGLGFQEIGQYGFATLVWRRTGGRAILELHASRQIAPGVVNELLPMLGIDGDKMEVLDLTAGTAVYRLKEVLGGTISYAQWEDDDEDSAVEKAAMWGRPARSLDEKNSKFMTEGHADRPGLSRRLDCRVEEREVAVTLSVKARSVVISPMSLAISGKILKGALQVGTFIPFNKSALPDYRASGGNPE